MIWNQILDEILRMQAEGGGSFSTAAELIGCNRNQVAGRAYRIGVRFASSKELHSARSSEGNFKAWSDPARAERRIAKMRRTRFGRFTGPS